MISWGQLQHLWTICLVCKMRKKQKAKIKIGTSFSTFGPASNCQSSWSRGPALVAEFAKASQLLLGDCKYKYKHNSCLTNLWISFIHLDGWFYWRKFKQTHIQHNFIWQSLLQIQMRVLIFNIPYRRLVKKRIFYGQADRKGGWGVSWNLILWHSKHILSYCERSQKCIFHALWTSTVSEISDH